MDVGEHIARSTDASRQPSFFGLVLARAGWAGPVPEVLGRRPGLAGTGSAWA